MFVVCPLILAALLPASGVSQFTNNPGTVYIHENYNGARDVWTGITGTCNVRRTVSYSCTQSRDYSCDYDNDDTCTEYYLDTCYRYEYLDENCNVCELSSNPSGHFQMNGLTVQKVECTTDTYCSSCSYSGCLNGGETYTVGVKCHRTGYDTNGEISTTFTVSVTYASPPTFNYTEQTPTIVSHDTAGVGSVINAIIAYTADDGNDIDQAYYRLNSGPEASYLLGTTNLFTLDTSTGDVIVAKDLTMEFSNYYTMNLCVYDRRNREFCRDLDITLCACFQTPTCEDQEEYNLVDTYGTYTGHGGSSNTIFNMIYPPPSGHFTDFSSDWHDLTWSFDTNEFPEANISADTGEIFIERNISIWPAWPTQDYDQVVNVRNSESCYNSTCRFKIRVHYTNWPLDICSLPDSYSLHEDYDTEILIHTLYICDYNYYWEDNNTCEITDWSPRENNMFELRNHTHNSRDSSYTPGKDLFGTGGNIGNLRLICKIIQCFTVNAYQLYKLACQDPDCGFKYQTPRAYYCDTDIGCLTHNRTQQYTVTIQCSDAYNSTDTDVFTFNVIKNQAPVYRHLPTNIYLNRQTVTHFDNIFEIMYSDADNDDLIYEYTYDVDPGYFSTTAWGNYYDQLGNITMTTHLVDKDVNTSYTVTICGHERRNEICEDLTIHIQEYCSDAPQCSAANFSTNTQFAVGDTLFSISTLVYGGTFNSQDLSYSITSAQGSLFSVDSATGVVTIGESFDEIFDSATYSIVGYVYHAGSCSYGQCQLTVTVAAVNYAINITNLPSTVSISEDTTTAETLLIVETSDANTNDSFTCEIVNNSTVEPFYLDRVPPVSGDYVIKNRENGALSSATTTYIVSVECKDSHGGSDAGDLTIEVTLNQAPSFTNFTANATTSVNADPMNYNQGDTLYTVTATDNENDALTFTCNISSSIIPFECVAGATYVDIKVSRELRIDDDNGAIYSVQICLRDAKHSDQCGVLEVTFTRVKSRPEITNLPDSKTFAEDAAIGTTIYEAVISDPDIGESHFYSMTVDPPSERPAFNLDTSNGILTVGQSLNYERVNSYTFTFTVRDDYLDGLTEKTLKIAVTNVNEGNSISATTTTITFSENTVANTELTDPEFTCTDTDGDTTSYAIHSGIYNSYFSINSNSGRITLAQVWDLEGANSLHTSTSLVISCTDPGSLSSTIVITLNIEDVNDNSPVLTIVSGSFPISISPSTCLCSDLMTFAANDLDFSDDDDFEFGIMGEGVGSEYFRMVKTGTSTATLRLKKVPDFRNDKTFSMTVKVSDGEPSPLRDGAEGQIVYTPADPDETKSKESARCLTCTRIGKAVIGALAVEGAIILFFGLHILYTCFSSTDYSVKKLRLNIDKFRRRTRWSGGVTSDAAGKAVTTTNVIEMKNMKENKDERKREESSSGSSSSSSDSDDDGKIRPFPQRPNVGHTRFRTTHQHSMSRTPLSEGLPAPIYSSRAGFTSGGPPCSPGGIDPGFIV